MCLQVVTISTILTLKLILAPGWRSLGPGGEEGDQAARQPDAEDVVNVGGGAL